MDGIDIEITVRDDVTAAFGRAIEAAVDLTPAMGDIAGHMADETRERFETQRSPLGVPWKPSRRVEEHGGETLTLHGHLRNSIEEDYGSDYAAAGVLAGGPASIYARIHQEGGEIRPKEKKALSFGGRLVGKVVIPARPFLGFTDADADYAIETLAIHLGDAFGGDGAAA